MADPEAVARRYLEHLTVERGAEILTGLSADEAAAIAPSSIEYFLRWTASFLGGTLGSRADRRELIANCKWFWLQTWMWAVR
jgi:hypothetical protein